MKNPLTMLGVTVTFIHMMTSVNAQTAPGWIKIDEPEELRKLISGRKMEAGEYWAYSFRADGKMSYWQDGYDSISVREWTVKANGQLCLSVFSKPDRIIDCPTIEKTSTSPVRDRIRGTTGNQIIQFVDPTDDLIEAVTKTAGSE